MLFEGTHPNHHVKISPTPLFWKLTQEKFYGNTLYLQELTGNCNYFTMSFVVYYEIFSKGVRPVYKMKLSNLRLCYEKKINSIAVEKLTL
jgi:hypothetical protein